MILPRQDLRNSFMARVIGAAMLLLIVTTMGLNWYFSLRSADQLKSNLIQHGQSLTRTLARTSRIAVFTGNKDQLTTAASNIVTGPECQLIGFYDENGTLLQRYQGQGYQTNLASLTDTAVLRHIQGHSSLPSSVSEVGSSIIVIEPVLAEARYSADDLFADSLTPGATAGQVSIIGYVAMMTDISSIRHQRRVVFVWDSAFVIGITLFCGLFIWGVIHYLVAVPLRGLIGEIRRLDYDLRPVDSQRCAAIPSDFSEMIAILRTSYNTIYDLKNGLEEKVAARTRQLEFSNQELVAQKNALVSANEQLADTLAQLQTVQAQLVQSEKMAALGMMISGLSHEIKNSINFIATSVPLLEMTIAAALKEGGECPAARINVLLANIREGVDRTVRVISDLSTFCYDGGTGLVPVDILPGLKAAVAIVRREFGNRIAIGEDHPRALSMVNGLAGQLNQVFLNILLNAAQAISDQGEITVKSWEERDTVHISIADTGYGIDGRIITRIFDPFFTTKDVGKGTGLGLSISYSTIKSHGGDILVASTEGSGTTFEIVLPVAVR